MITAFFTDFVGIGTPVSGSGGRDPSDIIEDAGSRPAAYFAA